MVEITGVQPRSFAAKAGIRAGERLLSVNGHEIGDVLDYRFYCTDTDLELVVQNKTQIRTVQITKPEYDDLGLLFETYLMDQQRCCANKCIFCFIDQLPAGMRESLYFKDDDSRLSFLFGNYITMTNIGQREIDRIIHMHISPVNVSVHTTNPALRVQMMHNRFAGEKLQYIRQLADAGIKINCQLVLCRGINDGPELQRSMRDLAALYPAVESVAAVPAGLTKYRDGLYPLVAYDRQSARQVIDTIHRFSDEHYRLHGDRLVYPADEFFNLAEYEMPPASYYGEMAQLENGVGMCALLQDEFLDALAHCDQQPAGSKKTIATGVGAYKLIKSLVDEAEKKWHNINCEVVAIANDFFGRLITTTGLLTGADLYRQLKDRCDLGTVYISRTMLKHDEDIFLDDMTVAQLAQRLGVSVIVAENTGEALLQTLLA